jgi:choline dehydrogenase
LLPVLLPADRALDEFLHSSQQQAFLDAAPALGFPWVEDRNAPGAMGVGPLPVNSIDGVRQSAAVTYLAEARHRRNLAVMADAEVDR